MKRAALLALAGLIVLGLLAMPAAAGLAPSASSTRSVAPRAPQTPKSPMASQTEKEVREPSAPPILPPLPPERFFEGAGVIVGDASAFRADERAEILTRNGFRWVAVKVHHSTGLERKNLAELEAGWADGFLKRGIQVCGWGVGETKPDLEARLAARLVRQHGFACYIADAEAHYMGQGYGGDPARSAVFVRRFRAQLPTLPAALTTMGAAHKPWVYPFDYASWRDGGFALLPQAYLSIDANYCPRCTLEHSVRAGYPAARVHPMIGVGWTQGRPAQGGDDYAWRLALAGTRGFSVFLGETATEADFDALGAAIKAEGIAR